MSGWPVRRVTGRPPGRLPSRMTLPSPQRNLPGFRTALLAVLAAGLLGTALELLLLEHFEGSWQKVPIALLAIGLGAVAWQGFRPGRASLRVFRVVMILLCASGPAGLLLHYRGNVEFELEMQPGASGFGLFWEPGSGAASKIPHGTGADDAG